jgi:hypothetical protein
MAEATFNRELGAAPAGITRFGQLRTNDGLNVTVDSYRSFAADGNYGLADVYEITYGATGTATILLNAEAFGVAGIAVYKADGTLAGEVNAPKTTSSYRNWYRLQCNFCRHCNCLCAYARVVVRVSTV